MMNSGFIRRNRVATGWLFAPPLHSAWAIAISVWAVILPTALHLTILPRMNDQVCIIFCLFVLATSILCGSRYALAVAVGGAISCNTVLMGAPYTFHLQGSEIERLATFLGYSAFAILVVHFFRKAAARSIRHAKAKECSSGIVFSLDAGQAWASWYGLDMPVPLGPSDEVVEMMEDFIAQVELGKRLQQRVTGEPVARFSSNG